MALSDSTPLLEQFAHGQTNGQVNLRYALRTRWLAIGVGGDIPASASTIRQSILRAPAGRTVTIVSAGFVTDGGQASDATDYRSILLGKHDGAGGSVTPFDTKGGASTAVTADSYTAFTIVESTDTLAATEVLQVSITGNGAGKAWSWTTVHVEYRID